jgi:Cu/Zn superoxide dismutase
VLEGADFRDSEPGSAAEAPNPSATRAAEGNDTLYTAVLEAADSTASVVEGQVFLVANDEDEPLELVVRGRGLAPGEHAWHVHSGPCRASGAVRIALSETARDDGIANAIDVNDDGEFEESADVPEFTRAMVGSLLHSLHIHQNPGVDHGPTVACATL